MSHKNSLVLVTSSCFQHCFYSAAVMEYSMKESGSAWYIIKRSVATKYYSHSILPKYQYAPYLSTAVGLRRIITGYSSSLSIMFCLKRIKEKSMHTIMNETQVKLKNETLLLFFLFKYPTSRFFETHDFFLKLTPSVLPLDMKNNNYITMHLTEWPHIWLVT